MSEFRFKVGDYVVFLNHKEEYKKTYQVSDRDRYYTANHTENYYDLFDGGHLSYFVEESWLEPANPQEVAHYFAEQICEGIL
jgi:hypothetical protein